MLHRHILFIKPHFNLLIVFKQFCGALITPTCTHKYSFGGLGYVFLMQISFKSFRKNGGRGIVSLECNWTGSKLYLYHHYQTFANTILMERMTVSDSYQKASGFHYQLSLLPSLSVLFSLWTFNILHENLVNCWRKLIFIYIFMETWLPSLYISLGAFRQDAGPGSEGCWHRIS